MNILSWLTRTEKTSQERAEAIFQKMLKGGESAVSESDAQFAVSVIGRGEIQRRHVADEERRHQEQRRREIPAELRDIESKCVGLHRSIPATIKQIDETRKKLSREIEDLEKSAGQQRQDLRAGMKKIEDLRRESSTLGLAFPENTVLPPRPSQAPPPPPIPLPPKPDFTKKSSWAAETPRPAWQTNVV
jgi:septal ring factor EnvC (AmiA/AmiB activator)